MPTVETYKRRETYTIHGGGTHMAETDTHAKGYKDRRTHIRRDSYTDEPY